jgi:hypothetical protein
MAKCRIGTAKFFTLLLLLYRTSANVPGANHSLETGDICRDILTLGRVMDIVQDRISSL